MTEITTYPLRLPRSLKKAIEKQSEEDCTSINQFVATAVAEKLSALQVAEFFAMQSECGFQGARQNHQTKRRKAAACRRRNVALRLGSVKSSLMALHETLRSPQLAPAAQFSTE
jgi:hypothetical protein